MMMYGYGGAWWMMLIDVLIPVLVIAVIVVAVSRCFAGGEPCSRR